MLPGPDHIHQCPHCQALFKVPSMISGNTFGALIWTDLKLEGGMMLEVPEITRCRQCHGFFQVEDAPVIGEIQPWEQRDSGINSAWLEAPEIRELTELQYYKALDLGFTRNNEQEITLRIAAWWRSNDRFRKPPERHKPLSPRRSELRNRNIQRLFEILDPTSSEELVLKAEAARQLGLFQQTLELLEFDPCLRDPKGDYSVIDLIIELARGRNSDLALVIPAAYQ